MKRIISLLILLFSGLFSFPYFAWSEGSKQLNTGCSGTQSTSLYLCNNFATQCYTVNGYRSQFAVYNATQSTDTNQRLYFVTQANEDVYMGFKGTPSAGSVHIVYRICNNTGTVVYAEQNLPTSSPGYISTLSQACNGPNQLLPPPANTGYNAIIWTPPAAGKYYIEFSQKNTSNNFVYDLFTIDLFDITIYNNTTSQVMPGRLYCKSWQFTESNDFTGINYVISDDGIVTSIQFSNMNGGAWIQYANQTGCGNTNWVVDRKSLFNQQALFPQYKIFLNSPDPNIFPIATTLGQIITPAPYGVRSCDGTVNFFVNVDKAGNVEIDLSFTPSTYTPRTLSMAVVAGTNTIFWDGKDGSGVDVPNNVLVAFTVKYINGLTNLPLYDVEGNPNGFLVALVAPPGTAPNIYWDDTNIWNGTCGSCPAGKGTNTLDVESNVATGGCASPSSFPGCHKWPSTGNGWGNLNTINSWWYTVSTSTAYPAITEMRSPQTLVFTQTPPQIFCAGTTGQLFSVSIDPNTDVYHWSYSGTGATIHQVNPSDYFVTVDFALNSTSGNLQVYGTNSNCPSQGPTSSLPITIKPVPVLNPPSPNTICAGVATNITLTSVPASTVFNWSSTPPTCSPNIIFCPPGQAGSNHITDVLNLNNSSPGTVVYHIISILNGCSSTPQDFTLTVLPAPVPVIAGNASVCAGSTGVIYSTLAGMTGYNWTISGGGTITAGLGTNSITVTWNTVGAQTVSVGYTDANSCTSLSPSVYNVTVHPLPVPTIAGLNGVCEGSTGNVYVTQAGMSNYTWNISAGGTITSGGTLADNTVTITWNTTGAQTVAVNYINGNGCTALAPVTFNLVVNPLPVPTIAGNTSVCSGTTGVVYTTQAGMSNYQWSVSAGGTVSAGGSSTDNSITIIWNTPGAQTVSVNYHDPNGCTAVSPTNYTVTVHPLPIVTISGNIAVCAGTTGLVYTTQAGMTNYLWNVSGGGTITAGGSATDNTVTVTWNTAGAQTVSVNYNDLNGCTAVSPTVYSVTVNPLPVVTLAGPAALCVLSTGNIYTTQAGMSNYTWNISAGGTVTAGGTLTDNTVTVTWNTAGAQTVAVNYINGNGCTALTPFTFNLIVNPLPVPTIAGNTSVCSGTTGVVYTTQAGMSNYQWSVSAGGTVTAGGSSTDNSITITWNTPGAQTVSINYHDPNGCTVVSPTNYTVTVHPLPVVTISGNTSVCAGTTALVYTTQAGMTSYFWNVSGGGTITAGGSVTDNTVTVTWNTAGAQTVSVNYNDLNGCTAVSPTVYSVTVNPLPVITIAGPGNVCALSSGNVYTTEAGMSNYQWLVSAGGVITAGGTNASNSVTVTWNTTGIHTVSVNYHDLNGCTAVASTSYTVTVNVLPVPTISGATSVCLGSTTVYSTEAGMSNYTWTVTAGGNIVSGANTNTLNILWTANGNNTVTVNYNDLNGCTAVTATSYTVNVTTLPVPSLTGLNAICSGFSTTYTTDLGMSNYSWTVTSGGTVTAGGGTTDNIVTVLWTTPGAQIVTVNYMVGPSCSAQSPTVLPVTVNSLPVPAIAGSNVLCSGTTGVVYSTLPGMTNYQWVISAGGTITAGGGVNDNTVTVTWNTPGAKTVSLNYHDLNGCTAVSPAIYNVTVNPLPTPTITGLASVCLTFNSTYTTEAGMNNYSWTVSAGGTITAGAGTNAVTINWTTTGAKTVTVNYFNGFNCTAQSATTYPVTVNPLPNPTLTGTMSICSGFSATYTTEAGMLNYTWLISPGGTVTAGGGNNNNTTTVLWTTVGTQSVSVNYFFATGCTAGSPTILNVTVNPLPVVTLAGTPVVCAGTTGLVYGTQAGMSNYQWTVSAGGTVTAGGTNSNNTVTVTWTTPGAQMVTVNYHDANGCTALSSATYPVTVNPLPIPGISGPASVCLNSSAIYITETGMSNYLWSVPAGGSIISGTGTNSINILWSTIGPKTITVNYNDTHGCTAVTPTFYTVNVNTLPVPSLNGSNIICSGNSTIYSTDAGMNNYSWLVSAGGTIIAGGGTTDNSVTVMWNTAGLQTVSVNYNVGTGCTASAATVLNVTVKPRPSVTNVANSTTCSNVPISIALLGSLPGTTFSWTATGSSPSVTGFHPGAGFSITDNLVNSGFNIETVNYSVTPSLNGCDGSIANFIVTVYPVADVYFTPNGQSFCSSGTTNISIASHVTGTIFTWVASGSSGNITGFGPGNTNQISQILTNSGNYPESVTYTVSPTANNCPGTNNSVVVNVNPFPATSYTPCNDFITTTAAQPFRLKGGLPLGGTYSGTGVNTGIFYPSIAGMGNHTITYSYTNTWGCIANAAQVISVINPPVFLCDNSMNDIRDNQTYTTVKIGTQCWMSENLNYGNLIVSTQMQRDNCISEKYCFGDIPANCTSYGGLYQWDELMQYDNVAAAQGFCPPGWHVPTENEWNTLFNFYISNGFAGSPLKYSGYSGFDAFLSGTRFNNTNWYFSNFAVMFWSSTQEGNNKAWAHGMNTFNPSVSYYPGSRTHAFNVRCIKD